MASSTIIIDYLGAGVFASRPVTPNIPTGGSAFYYATDTVALYAWTSAAWVLVGTGAGAAGTFAALTDVNLSGLANNDLARYLTSDSKWHNVTLTAYLDAVLASTQGYIITRGASAWLAAQGINYNAAAVPQLPADTRFYTQSADATVNRVLLDSHGASLTGASEAVPILFLRTSRGTAASPTAIQSGDGMGRVAFGGRAATGYSGTVGGTLLARRASLLAYASENWTDTANGTKVVIESTPNGSVTPAEVVTIAGDGGILDPPGVTGGSKGSGTINISGGYYLNGAALAASDLATILDGYVLGNKSGGASAPSGQKITDMIDYVFGTAQGDLLYRNATVWTVLAPGTTGQFLKTLGAAANPAWATITPGSTTLAGDTDVSLSSLAQYDQLIYSGSVWENKRPRYIVAAAAMSGVLTNSQKVLYHRFSKAVTFPANFGSYLGHASQAGGSAVTTASTVVNVDKAATATPNTFSNVGTITFAIATVTPTFATSGGAAVSFAQGDVIRIVGPASADATFADFYATLVGYET